MRLSTVLFRIQDVNLAEFGWPCGDTFISNRSRCWTDPKTGKRLKKPIPYKVYQKIQESNSKAAKTLYKDREQKIRDKRKASVPGWKKKENQGWKAKADQTFKDLFVDRNEITINTTANGGTAKVKYVQDDRLGINYLEIDDGSKRKKQFRTTKEDLENYVQDLHNPKVAKAFGFAANPRVEPPSQNTLKKTEAPTPNKRSQQGKTQNWKAKAEQEFNDLMEGKDLEVGTVYGGTAKIRWVDNGPGDYYLESEVGDNQKEIFSYNKKGVKGLLMKMNSPGTKKEDRLMDIAPPGFTKVRGKEGSFLLSQQEVKVLSGRDKLEPEDYGTVFIKPDDVELGRQVSATNDPDLIKKWQGKFLRTRSPMSDYERKQVVQDLEDFKNPKPKPEIVVPKEKVEIPEFPLAVPEDGSLSTQGSKKEFLKAYKEMYKNFKDSPRQTEEADELLLDVFDAKKTRLKIADLKDKIQKNKEAKERGRPTSDPDRMSGDMLEYTKGNIAFLERRQQKVDNYIARGAFHSNTVMRDSVKQSFYADPGTSPASLGYIAPSPQAMDKAYKLLQKRRDELNAEAIANKANKKTKKRSPKNRNDFFFFEASRHIVTAQFNRPTRTTHREKIKLLPKLVIAGRIWE